MPELFGGERVILEGNVRKIKGGLPLAYWCAIFPFYGFYPLSIHSKMELMRCPSPPSPPTLIVTADSGAAKTAKDTLLATLLPFGEPPAVYVSKGVGVNVRLLETGFLGSLCICDSKITFTSPIGSGDSVTKRRGSHLRRPWARVIKPCHILQRDDACEHVLIFTHMDRMPLSVIALADLCSCSCQLANKGNRDFPFALDDGW